MAGLGLTMKKRLIFLLVTFSVLIAALVVRVGWIQIVQGDFYQKKAFSQQTRGRDISPKRGTIFDRNGKPLAVSASVEKITINPQEVRESKLDQETIADNLGEILGMNPEGILKKIKKKSMYEIIKRKIDDEVGNNIRKWAKEHDVGGIYIDEDSKRYYPNRNLAAHILGFTGDDNQGLDGIEAVMDKYLKGVPGKILSETDARGRGLPLNEEKHIGVQDGANIVLTIDETIQYFAQRALEKAVTDNMVLNGATAIVTDPRNGDILAMVSKPDFDPNDPFGCPTDTDKAEWEGMSSEEKKAMFSVVWRNKAVVDTYEPGSTFKAITAAAGLEEGIVTPQTRVNDFPVIVQGNTIKCWRGYRPHGEESFAEGVYNSCNPVFVRLAQVMGVSKFYKYMKAFGFYDRTGIELPGEAQSQIHAQPKEIDMAVAAFGQRFQISPIQLISSYGAIANGGTLMKPRVIKEITDSDGNIIERFEPQPVRNVISKQTSDTLCEILEGVVSVDTATGGNAYVPGYRVAGKTGTSETTETKSKGRYIASFSAFAPADNPVICVLVVLDYPDPSSPFGHGGGKIAAPVVRDIIENSLEYLGVERRYTEKDKEELEDQVTVPDVRGKSTAEARQILSATGVNLKYSIEGEGYDNNTIVVEQSPKPGISLTKKSVVILYTYKPQQGIKVKMPDIKNKTIDEAVETLSKVGLNVKGKGIGVVVEQQFEPGTELEKGTVVEVELRFLDTE
ncbi:stage V sporulation protein D (sporulation-specific penicillin-binding protein) [Anaerobacterium chartisolvens]|uniref:Stage V sporulation protein D (Sporulation-specific penicillin-binding protein) n=1 Tax=Anaerobacterium chartisolvens TaxID=1297424 RepID=A0A369B504_9FIRM|nr:PASTA domain-containing penicillin-binding protein [Anaerobacterium chartisolvens]RCX16563.1 stage V sporulation protein D (sporulation-specific penicillin-binding protein) [Anaerobacterium chartisolvens]